MSTWPPGLPQCALRGKQRSPLPNVISFGTEVGPGKVRRRSTARVMRMSFNFVITRAQVSVFEDWFQGELKDGSLTYHWPDPVTAADAEWLFDPANPYTLQERASGKWDLSVSVARQP